MISLQVLPGQREIQPQPLCSHMAQGYRTAEGRACLPLVGTETPQLKLPEFQVPCSSVYPGKAATLNKSNRRASSATFSLKKIKPLLSFFPLNELEM